jgi:steroid 5-alpha reductase family enzyme
MKALSVVYLLAIAMAWAGSQGGTAAAGFPVFAWCALLAFALQWLAYIPAYLRQTERFYDLTGSITYVSGTLLAVALSGAMDDRSLLLAGFILVWAARLGSFLFKRISEDGSDSRFDKIKPDPLRFFVTWSLQGLWVLITAGCAWAAITSAPVPLSAVDGLGIALWLCGFAIEVIADRQKRRFRAEAGPEAFIQSGLWARSRHPNYFGEIMLWFGIALLALPALQGWQLATLVSPLFVYLLLTRVSGIPLLEKKADRKWGGRDDYEAYKASTPLLVPRLF